MKLLLIRHIRSLACVCTLAAVVFPLKGASSTAPPVQKMKAEEVIEKHLESLGPASARTDEQGRVALGNARAIFRARNSLGSIDGRVVLASLNGKAMLAMGFNSPSYTGEKFGFDGKKFTVGYVSPGIRSTLGNFLLQNGEIFREGLMAGTLSSTWPLIKLQERGAKVEYSGTDKINETRVHKLAYFPKKGSDVKITLYFDATTFEHVRTQYDRTIASRLSAGGIDAQARQMETRYRMIENFSGYKKAGNLNLPHSYSVQLEITKTTGSSVDKWETELTEFLFNQQIDEKGFDVEAS